MRMLKMILCVLLRVAKAIELNKNGKEIKFSAPAFWGNMMSLVCRKF